MSIKQFFKKTPLFTFYKKCHIGERIRLIQDRNKMEEFAQKGDAVIDYVHQVLEKAGYMYFVDAGTLIGIYRDGHLLKRDMDVDMGVVTKTQEDVLKIRQYLIDNGFELKLVFSTPKNGYIQDAFDYDGIRVDMCYFIEEDDTTACYVLYEGNRIIKMTFSRIKSTKSFKYSNHSVKIPVDSEKYLEERYGKNWRTPDPFFKYWEGPCVTPEEGIGNCEHIS